MLVTGGLFAVCHSNAEVGVGGLRFGGWVPVSGFRGSAPDPANLIKDQSSAVGGLMARLLGWAAACWVGGAVRAVWSRPKSSQSESHPRGEVKSRKACDLTSPLGRDKGCGTTRDGTTPPEPRVSS